MPKYTDLALCGALFVTAAAYSADGDQQQQKMSEVAPAESLQAAAVDKIENLQKYVADADTFGKSGRNLKRDAGVLAVLAQAIAEHDQDSSLKKSAIPLRDAALKLAAATSHSDAAQSFESITAAQAGQAGDGELNRDWAQLIDFDSLMAEVNLRNRNVGRSERKMRRGLGQQARDEAARDADILAVLSLVVQADTHEIKEGGDVAGWKKYAADERTAAIETAAAFRTNDAKGVQSAYAALRKSCSGCHKDYRE